MDIIKLYESFQKEFIKKTETLSKGVFFILVGESLLKDMDDKPIIIPVISNNRDIVDLRPVINNLIEESGKSVKIQCIMCFDVKEKELISSLEYLGEKVSNQERITLSINKETIVDESYQIF